jgi:hypothetical protein
LYIYSWKLNQVPANKKCNKENDHQPMTRTAINEPMDCLEASQWLRLQWGFSKNCHCSGLSKRWSSAVGFGWCQRPLLAHGQAVRGTGWPRVGCWCDLVRFVSFRRVLGLMEILVRSWPCRVLVFPLESGVCVVGVSWCEFSVFSFCQVYVKLFFFYQYNDTQLSCVFEKKNRNEPKTIWQVDHQSFELPLC